MPFDTTNIGPKKEVLIAFVILCGTECQEDANCHHIYRRQVYDSNNEGSKCFDLVLLCLALESRSSVIAKERIWTIKKKDRQTDLRRVINQPLITSKQLKAEGHQDPIFCANTVSITLCWAWLHQITFLETCTSFTIWNELPWATNKMQHLALARLH